MTAEEARERAIANFKSGMNCTQSVVSVFAEEFGYSPEQIGALVQPFGGGMCRMREVCGTVSGMLFSLGMYNSSLGKKVDGFGGEKSQKDDTYAKGQKLAARFRELNGSIVCRELLGLVPLGTSENLLKEKKADAHEFSAPTSEARTEEYYKKRPCAQLCGLAAEIFQKFLDEENALGAVGARSVAEGNETPKDPTAAGSGNAR